MIYLQLITKKHAIQYIFVNHMWYIAFLYTLLLLVFCLSDRLELFLYNFEHMFIQWKLPSMLILIIIGHYEIHEEKKRLSTCEGN